MTETVGATSDEILSGVVDQMPPPTHIKRYIVYALGRSTIGGPALEELELRIHSIDDFDIDGSINEEGTRFKGDIENFIKEMPGKLPRVAPKDVLLFTGQSTPLDISVVHPSHIVIWLYGDFWEFMRKNQIKDADRIKAKKNTTNHGNKYGNLNGWRIERGLSGWTLSESDENQWANMISFQCDQPEPAENKVKHAFNFYINIKAAGQNILPIIIDPNVENKGGPPPFTPAP
jgi:hypothetical protein